MMVKIIIAYKTFSLINHYVFDATKTWNEDQNGLIELYWWWSAPRDQAKDQ